VRIRLVIAASILMSTPALAQQPAAPPDARAALRSGFNEVTGWIMRTAEMATAEQLNYRPVATVRTLGEQLAHIADAHNWYCQQATGQNVEWSDRLEKSVAGNKTALIQALRQSIAGCNSAYAGSTARIDRLMANVTHDHQHYGNIVTYLRMQGLTPPSN